MRQIARRVPQETLGMLVGATGRSGHPWTTAQCESVWLAFGTRLQRAHAVGIVNFFTRASAYRDRVEAEPLIPAGQILAQQRALSAAAGKLLRAIKGMSTEAMRELVVTGSALAGTLDEMTRDEAVIRDRIKHTPLGEQAPPGPTQSGSHMEQRMQLEMLQALAKVTKLNVDAIPKLFPTTNRKRWKDTARLDLASYLRLSWVIEMGGSPSLSKGSTFHNVATAVSEVFGFGPLGASVLKRAGDLDNPPPRQ